MNAMAFQHMQVLGYCWPEELQIVCLQWRGFVFWLAGKIYAR